MRVLGPAGEQERPHGLDLCRRHGPHLLLARAWRLADLPDRVRRYPLGLERALHDRPEQLERVTHRYRPRALRQPVGLPASDRLGVDRAQRQGTQKRAQVMVVEGDVVAAGLDRELAGVGRRPRPGHVPVERLAAGVEQVQRAELLAAADLGVPLLRVPAGVERAGPVPSAFAPPDAPDGTGAAGDLLDAHLRRIDHGRLGSADSVDALGERAGRLRMHRGSLPLVPGPGRSNAAGPLCCCEH